LLAAFIGSFAICYYLKISNAKIFTTPIRNPMQVDVCSAPQLNKNDWSRWQQIQKNNPLLANPYFCPEFTQLVATVRDDVYIAILRRREQIVGFFPFQRWSHRYARPVAGPLSDYQGLIIEPGMDINPLEVIKKCGLQRWEFDHLLVQQTGFSPYWTQTTVSSIIDLSQGFEAYHQARLREHSKRFKQIARSARQMAKEVGELRYESHVTDRSVLHQLLEWKSEQCHRTDMTDIFGFQWARKLVEQIQQTQTQSFAGVLSVIYAGQNLVAAHMGMRSETIWHYWFPSYNHNFKKIFSRIHTVTGNG
jgi:CelD/BcsL family acetyltransferase involved in cellulose biosynthesis